MSKKYPWESIATGHEKIASIKLPNTKQLYWTVSQKGLYGLMFKSQENIKKNTKTPTMDGFDFDLQLDEGETRFFINLKSFDSKDFFLIICNDLIEKVENLQDKDSKIIIDQIVRALERWQNLFKKVKEGLSKSEQIGLLGELIFLEKMVLDGLEKYEAIQSWAKPSDTAEQDFSYGNVLYEIKTQKQTSDKKISISSLEQLNIKSGKIFLIHQTISNNKDKEEKLPTFSLFKKVNELRNIFKEDSENIQTINLFEQKLLESKYEDKDEYDEDLYSLVQRRYYEVSSTFPRITKLKVHPLIQTASYTLNTTDLDPWEIKNLKVTKVNTALKYEDINFLDENIIENKNIEFKASFRVPYPKMPDPIKNDKGQLIYKFGKYELTSKEQIFKAVSEITLKEISAMLNTQGGALVLGIHEQGTEKELCGIERDLKDNAKIKNLDEYFRHIEAKISAEIGQYSNFINIYKSRNSYFSDKNKQICIIEISKLPIDDICSFKNKVYIREGSSTREVHTKDLIKHIRNRQ